MDKPKISVIIPAANEEKFIPRTIQAYRLQGYDPLEIIVVVNNSSDKTYQLALKTADKVLRIKGNITVGAARNRGAEVATGDIFLFSDADTYVTAGCLEKIAEVTGENTIGIPLGKPYEQELRGKLFFFYKNLGHRLRLYRSAVFGVIFCHKSVFSKLGGFNETKHIAEYADFIKRARKIGVRYVLLRRQYAITSLRRFQKNGYMKEYLFWIQWRIASLFGKGEALEKEYFNQ